MLAISHVQNISLDELWITFGVGKHYGYIAAYQIAEALGEHRSRPLLFFHAFTGCDVISFFSGRGKKSPWHVWEVLPELTDTFSELAFSPVTVSEDIMLLIDKFLVFGMIEQVNLEQLVKQDNIFSVDDPEYWKIYLQLQLLSDSTL